MLESLDEEAEEGGKSRAEHIRDILNNRNDTDEHERITELENEVQQLESELRDVRSERDELRGRIKEKTKQVEDMRDIHSQALAAISQSPAIEADVSEGEIKSVEFTEAETRDESDESGSRWLFWR